MTTTKFQKTIIEIKGTEHIDGIGETITITGLWADDYEINAAKAEKKNINACACCGRALKPGRGFDIWAVNGGDGLAPVIAWDQMSKYQGAWVAGDLGNLVVGPDCGKQIPVEYRQARSGS